MQIRILPNRETSRRTIDQRGKKFRDVLCKDKKTGKYWSSIIYHASDTSDIIKDEMLSKRFWVFSIKFHYNFYIILIFWKISWII